MSVRDRLVGVARRVDRKIFRRSVYLLERTGQLRDELHDARQEIEDLRTALASYAAAVEQERRETRAQFVVIRALLSTQEHGGASRS
jgi:predicted  nucleic acid-binding Zn-ribbon protein